MRRKFQAVARHITRLQATIRMRRTRKRYRKLLAIRANAAFKVRATMLMARARRRCVPLASVSRAPR